MFFSLVLILTVISGMNAVGDSDVLRYYPGHMYEYSFDSSMSIRYKSEDISLKIVGTAKIFAKDECNYVVQLGGVKVSASQDDAEKKILQGIQKPVQFTMSKKGKLEEVLHVAESGESLYALNIKRSIISLLEHNDVAENEVDVFGYCPKTQTSINEEGRTKIVTKVRNLNNCKNYGIINSSFFTNAVIHKVGLKSKSITILDAVYTKEVKLQNGVVATVQVTENYFYNDEKSIISSKHKNNFAINARVVTKAKLKQLSGTPSAAPTTGSRRASIIFQQPEAYVAKSLLVLEEALKKVIKELEVYVKEKAAEYFGELIRLMRHADVDTLQQLYAFTLDYPKKDLARNVFLDALFRTSTTESTQIILKQIVNMIEKERLMAISALNLVKVIDKKTLNEALSILMTPNTFKHAYLGMGALVSKYCSIGENNCNNGAEEIKIISKKFIDTLKHCKAATKKEEERLIYVLKGIEKSQILSETVGAALAECTTVGRSNRIRVTALRAISVARCETMVKTRALDMLKDRTEDSEIRLEAFLVVIQCPSVELANELTDLINSEPINTVGSFIASTLKLIRDSSDKTYANQRKYFANINVTKKYVVDMRRFSYNGELSYDFRPMGMSSIANYKVIYSQNGFLPRSSYVSLKSELSGVEFNVVQAGVRMENMENVLEFIFGPKGLINRNVHLSDILKTQNVDDNSRIHHPRLHRSIADESIKAAKKYKSLKQTDDINFDVDIKIFGSELGFLSLGDNIPTRFDDISKILSNSFHDMKHNLKDYNNKFVGHDVFMDTLITFPTGVGVPLILTVQGFLTQVLDFGININVDAIRQGKIYNKQYKLHIEPSISANMIIKLEFNAYVFSTGIRASLLAHSATGSTLNLSIDPSHTGFDLSVELPNEKLELINIGMNYDFYTAKADDGIKLFPLKRTTYNKNNNITCFNKLKNLGILPCFSTIPREREEGNQLVTTSKFSFYVIALNKFSIKGKYLESDEEDNKVEQWQLLYITPENLHDTSMILEFSHEPRLYIRMTLYNVNFNYTYEIGFNNNEKEVVLYSQYNRSRDVKKKNMIGYTKNGSEYQPLIEIDDGLGGVTNEIFGYSANGSVFITFTPESKRYDFNQLQLIKRNGDRWIISGWLVTTGSKLKSEVKLSVSPEDRTYFIQSEFEIKSGQEYNVSLFFNNIHKPESVYGIAVNSQLNESISNINLVGKYDKWELQTTHKLHYTNPLIIKSIYTHFSNSFIVKHKNKNVLFIKTIVMYIEDKKYEFVSNAIIDFQKDKNNIKGSLEIKLFSETTGSNYMSYTDLTINTKINQHFMNFIYRAHPEGTLYHIEQKFSSSFGALLTIKGVISESALKSLTLSSLLIKNEDLLINLECSGKLFNDKPSSSMYKLLFKVKKEQTFSKTEMFLEKRGSEGEEQVLQFIYLLQDEEFFNRFNLNIEVQNVISVKTDINFEKTGKGDFSVAVEPLTTESRKVTVTGKYFIQKPIYEVEANISYGIDHFLDIKSENLLDHYNHNYSTKTIIKRPNNENISLEFQGRCKDTSLLNNEFDSSYSFSSSSYGIIEGVVKRKFNIHPKTKIIKGNGEIFISVREKNNLKRSLQLTVNVDKLFPHENEIIGNWDITYMNNKTIKFLFGGEIKNLRKEIGLNNRIFYMNMKAQGGYIKDKVIFNIKAEDYSLRKSNVTLELKYGQKHLDTLHMNYDIPKEGHNGFYIMELTSERPNSMLQNIKIKSQGLFVKDERGTNNIDFRLDIVADNERVINLIIKADAKDSKYNVKLIMDTSESGAYNIEGSFKIDLINKESILTYKNGPKFVEIIIQIASNEEKCSTNLIFKSNYEIIKYMKFIVESEKIGPNSLQWQLLLQEKPEQKPYKLLTKLFTENHKKGFIFEADCFHCVDQHMGQISVSFYYELFQPQKLKFIVDIQNLLKLDFKFDIISSYYSNGLENFYLQSQLHSEKLHMRNYTLTLKTVQNVLQIDFRNENGKIFQGSLSYMNKKEQNKKYILEGKGSLIYKQQEKRINFKLIREVYELPNDNEVGLAYNFNANVASRNAVAILKITNKAFNVKLSICEEKKECTNAEILSSREVSFDETSTKSLLVFIDLRELGVPYELEIQTKHVLRESFNFENNVDIKVLGPNNNNYQWLLHSQPTQIKLNMSIPSREMLLEVKHQYPEGGKLFGHYGTCVTFFPNKVKQPKLMVELLVEADITGEKEESLRGKGLVKFIQSQVRPLIISGRFETHLQPLMADVEVDLDVFKTDDFKIKIKSHVENMATSGFNISASHVIKSNGFEFEYYIFNRIGLNANENRMLIISNEISNKKSAMESNAFFIVKPTEAEFTLYALNERIIQAKATYKSENSCANLDGQLLFGNIDSKPLNLKAQLRFSEAFLEINSRDILHLNSELSLGQHIKLKGHSPSMNTEFLYVKLGLNKDNMHESSWNSNEQELRKVTEALQQQWKIDFENIRKIMIERFHTSIGDKDIKGYLQKFLTDYTLDVTPLHLILNDILKDLQQDSALRYIFDFYFAIIAKTNYIVSTLQQVYDDGYERTKMTFMDLTQKIKDKACGVLWSSAKELFEKICLLSKTFITELTVTLVKLASIIVNPLKELYAKMLPDILRSFDDVFQDLQKILLHILKDMYKDICEHLQQLKNFGQLDENFKHLMNRLNLVEITFNVLDQAFKQLQNLPLHQENVFNKMNEYLITKFKQGSTNYLQYTEELYHLIKRIFHVIWSNWNVVDSSLKVSNLNNITHVNFASSFVWLYDFLQQFSFKNLHINQFNVFFNENWSHTFTTEYLRLLLFYEGFSLSGHVIDGRHFLTFDGSYVSFIGNCKYILALDVMHNNFSAIASLNNGKLKAIYLTDREGQFLEITDAGMLKFNGKIVEFPLHENGMHAWRMYYTVWVYTEYGISIMCTSDLKLCHVQVNGFYISRLRGILGNGNAEPYDDFMQIVGTLSNTALILNNYSLGKCQPVQLLATFSDNATPNVNISTEPQVSICSEMFSYKSPLALGHLFKSPNTFHLACDEAMSQANTDKDKESIACAFAMAYISAIRKKFDYPIVFLPLRCVKCAGSVGQRNVFDSFSVKTPNNKADVVFVVDIDIAPNQMRNLVGPTITKIRDVLKTRSFSDVQIGVIIYSSQQLYPAIVTSNNGKLNYQGDLNEVRMNGPKTYFNNLNLSEITNDKFLNIRQFFASLLKNLVPQSDEKAFNLAIHYPFRAQAAKAIVAVRSKSLQYDKMLTVLRAHIIGAVTKNSAIIHVLTPVDDIAVEGVSKLIGFNNRVIATLDGKDAKKRQNLTYAHDVCLDFVLSNGGWVFNTNAFDNFKPQEQNKMVTQVTNSVVDTMFKTEMISDCFCLPIYGFHAQHKCYIKTSNFIPNKKIKS